MKKIVLAIFCVVVLFASDEHDDNFRNDIDISAVADLSYVKRTISQHDFENLHVPGISHPEHEHEEHSHNLHSEEGFNFNYFEVEMEYEPSEDVTLFAALHGDGEDFVVEEVFFRKEDLFGQDLDIEVGKFYSGFGRQNALHADEWDFAQKPLIASLLLGDEGILEKGIQIALDYDQVIIGAEVLQGETLGTKGREDIGVADADTPALFVAFAKFGRNFGELDLKAGLSYAKGESKSDHDDHFVDADTILYGVDVELSYKRLLWRAEWIGRKMEGTKYEYDPLDALSLQKKQEGLYSELIYNLGKSWRTGVRYDWVTRNDVMEDGIRKNMPHHPYMTSVMAEYTPSRWLTFRLNAIRDASKKENFDAFIMQCVLRFGAHDH